ncbi:MAG TPA: M14 family zinc carboxypeptidase [Caldilineaceae bacterium]|nr:M14 family zinc carboxypeptidase [Caldilineaceae bacterium]
MDSSIGCGGPGRHWRRWIICGLAAICAVLLLRPAQAAEPLSEFPLFPPATDMTTLVVARLYFTNEALLNELTATLDVWEVHYGQTANTQYVVAMLSLAQLNVLRDSGLHVEIDQQKTAALTLQPVFGAGQQAGIPNYPCYRTVEETYADLAALAANHPGLATWSDIGDSWNKTNPGNGAGYDLNVLTLTNRARPGPKPSFFVMAAIHARELATAEVATRFAEMLVNGYGQDADITWILDNTEIHILAMSNPDGRKWAEQLLYWRKNTNRNDGCTSESPFLAYYGVDLNRNSSFKWGACEGQGCSTTQACRDTFRGSAPASEPETQAIQNYIRSLFPDLRGPGDDDPAPDDTPGLMISLHSYSRLVLYPWGWRATPSPNDRGLKTLAQKFGYYTKYPVCQSGGAGCLYMTDGTTDDWTYGELGVAAYTFELGDAFFESCSAFEQEILPNTLAALRYAAKATRRPYQSPAGPESSQPTATPARILSGTPVAVAALADDTRRTDNNGGDEPGQAIAAARYSVDSPSWVTGTLTYNMAAADGLFDAPLEAVEATVDTSGWLAGRHLLLVESQDTDGNWGVPSALFVDVLASPYGVVASAAPSSTTLPVGKTVSMTVVLTNTGLVSDSFDLAAVSGELGVVIPSQVGPLAPLQSVQVAVTVSAPLTTAITTQAPVTFTVTSLANPATQVQIQVSFAITAPTGEDETDEPKALQLFLPWINRP